MIHAGRHTVQRKVDASIGFKSDIPRLALPVGIARANPNHFIRRIDAKPIPGIIFKRDSITPLWFIVRENLPLEIDDSSR